MSNTAVVSYKWSEKGKQPIITQKQSHRERHTLFGSVNPRTGEVIVQKNDKGNAKTAYGHNRIRARLKGTSQSWIASIILVLNLVKLAGSVPLYLINKGTIKFYIFLKKWKIVFLELFLNEKIFYCCVLKHSG